MVSGNKQNACNLQSTDLQCMTSTAVIYLHSLGHGHQRLRDHSNGTPSAYTAPLRLTWQMLAVWRAV